MKLWIFNNYNMLPQHGPMNRHYYFAKQLQKMGHEPVVFVGSHPHNSDIQLIDGRERYSVFQREPFSWVLVKTCCYQKNKVKQVFSMFQYCVNAAKAAKSFEKPDAILGSSAHPLAAWLAIHLGRKYGCKAIVEVRDLWPESIVALGVAKKSNPLVLLLRRLEKWLYVHADAVVFTMEGAYDYIIEQGWEKDIPHSKVYYINNGVDLELFNYNKEHYQTDDADLDDPDTFKIIYTGSIRRANGLHLLVECAQQMQSYKNIRFLIYGTGVDLERLQKTCCEKNLTNCIFKGYVDKRYIPYILSKSSLNALNYDRDSVKMFRFGSSQNKLFDYMASGKPILSNVKIAHNLIERYHCGISENLMTGEQYAQAIQRVYHLPKEEYQSMCQNAQLAAHEYDFSTLALKLLSALEEKKD